METVKDAADVVRTRGRHALKAVCELVEVPPAQKKAPVTGRGSNDDDKTRVPRDASGGKPTVDVVCVADVDSGDVSWLWPGYVARGHITIISGDPGVGKSTFTLDLAARVTRDGVMPDGSQGVTGNVLLISAEDSVSCTIRPRLAAAGADLSRVHVLRSIGTGDDAHMPEFPDDLAAIEDVIVERNVVLVVIDPLDAYIGGKVDVHRNHHVRRVLAPLAGMAERTGAAPIVVRHLTKSTAGGPAMYRGQGSIGYTGASRSEVLVGRQPIVDELAERDPDAPIIFAPVKNNLGRLGASLAYRLVSCGAVARVAWLGRIDVSADDLCSAVGGRSGPPPEARDEAKAWLLAFLDGVEKTVPAIRDAAKKHGIAWRTLERAKSAAGVRARPSGADGWVWCPPRAKGDAKGKTATGVPTWQPGGLRARTGLEGA